MSKLNGGLNGGVQRKQYLIAVDNCRTFRFVPLMEGKQPIKQLIKKHFGVSEVQKIESVQSLWGGYGTIDRYRLLASEATIIVKHVSPPAALNHPRGWNTDFGHERKLKSYKVEAQWYHQWSAQCTEVCRVPKYFARHQEGHETILLLEDLDHAGFDERPSSIGLKAMDVCLQWLANFHSTFLNQAPRGLWTTGSYWHLQTRPEELRQLEDLELKTAAKKIDRLLRKCPYQTIIHGDAKLANFCFSRDLTKVAAVDFQYVGGGVGIKDVAYFIGSCLDESDCEKYEQRLLDTYFHALRRAFQNKPLFNPLDFDDLEVQWRRLYPVAWTDFHRFLKGWSPGHWKLHSYSERLSRQVLRELSAKLA